MLRTIRIIRIEIIKIRIIKIKIEIKIFQILLHLLKDCFKELHLNLICMSFAKNPKIEKAEKIEKIEKKEKENNNQSTFNATINIPPNSLNHSNVSSSNTTTTSSSSLSSLNTNANGLLFTNSQQQLPQRAQKFKMKSKSNEKLDFEIPHLTPNLAIEKNSHRRKHFSMEVTPTVIPEEEKDSNKKKKNKNNLHNPNEPQMLHYFKAEILEAIEPFLGNQFDCIFLLQLIREAKLMYETNTQNECLLAMRELRKKKEEKEEKKEKKQNPVQIMLEVRL